MTTQTSEERGRTIRRAMAETVETYGKIGVLVDDALDAESRVARELYGPEVLPRWWHVAQSQECARHALKELKDLSSPDRTGDLVPAILLMDRYLPSRCAGTVPEPWDALDRSALGSSNEEDRKQLHADATELAGREGRIVAKFVTSYESALGHELEPRVAWDARRLGAIRSIREVINPRPGERHLLEGLLRFGPERNLSPSGAPSSGKGLRTRPGYIDQLTPRFNGNTVMILVAGSGVSDALGTRGAGFPPKARFDAEFKQLLGRKDRGALGPPGERRACICRSAALENEPSKEASQRRSVETLFEALSEEDDALHRKAVCSFRALMREYDVRFAYHHWLMVRLPWRAIITTTCDGFLERAAAAAARVAANDDERRAIGSLGMLYDWNAAQVRISSAVLTGASVEGKLAWSEPGDGRLYKLYDHLFAPVTDYRVTEITDYAAVEREADRAEDEADRAKRAVARMRVEMDRSATWRARVALSTLLTDAQLCVIVAVGMSKDELLWFDKAAREVRSGRWDERGKIWVDPTAVGVTGWTAWPATPLEFAYDLWRAVAA